jgi:hypothetical protein
MLNFNIQHFYYIPGKNYGIPLFILLEMCGMYVSLLFVILYELSEDGQYNVRNVWQ